MQLLAVGLLLVGFAFKVSAIPFHMWTPDAYEGGADRGHRLHVHRREGGRVRRVRPRLPLCVRTARIRSGAPLVWAIAMATMIGGTVVGVAQTSVKRMLAYSSIAHAGYLLVALVSANDVGKGAVLFYLLAYAVTNLGAFGVVAVLETSDRPFDQVQRLCGPVERASWRWPR